MRLIDADELIEHAWRDRLDSRERIAEMIENAPTIVLADMLTGRPCGVCKNHKDGSCAAWDCPFEGGRK